MCGKIDPAATFVKEKKDPGGYERQEDTEVPHVGEGWSLMTHGSKSEIAWRPQINLPVSEVGYREAGEGPHHDL